MQWACGSGCRAASEACHHRRRIQERVQRGARALQIRRVQHALGAGAALITCGCRILPNSCFRLRTRLQRGAYRFQHADTTIRDGGRSSRTRRSRIRKGNRPSRRRTSLPSGRAPPARRVPGIYLEAAGKLLLRPVRMHRHAHRWHVRHDMPVSGRGVDIMPKASAFSWSWCAAHKRGSRKRPLSRDYLTFV